MNDKATGKTIKPLANYTLSSEEVRVVYQWIKEPKMPDGYSSNISRCANMEGLSMQGMKSRDCHVFMECLLPIAFSKLPAQNLNPLIEISQFFKNLCSTTPRNEDLIKMEQDIPLII